jgi:tetratricopeptide (TPR) repeat protein
MRTFHPMSAATPRSWFLVLIALWASVPALCGASSNRTLSDQGSSVSYGLLDLAQDSPTKTGMNPQTQPASITTYQEFGLASVDAETQGDLMMIHQRYLSAITAYQRAPKDSAIVWNKMGIAYQHMYALDFAKSQYEKALSINPKYPEALNNLGTVFYGEKNYRKAETYYKKALRLKPDCASFYSNLGTAYFADQRYKLGVDAYQHAFAIDPQVFIRESIERIAELGPLEEQAKLNYALAKLYAQAGNLEVAIQYLRHALMEGFDDRKKLMADKEFAALRVTPEFHLLMAEEHLN